MTVSYSNKVATSSFSCFLKLLFRWRGSIYKLLWRDFAVFATFYYILSFTYRFLLNATYKRWFEKISIYCQEFNNLIPIAFVLGFYVSIVVNRFWEQFRSIPYPNRMAMFVTTLVTGNDDRGRLMRRTIMRYLNLTFVMTMSSISPPVKKRFPQLEHMKDAGFMTDNELTVLTTMKTSSNKYFVPLVWAGSVITRARKEGRIKDDFAVKTLIDEINEFRGKCGQLFSFDWITVPLVYTQVVTLAVYMFFLSCLMGRQFLENGRVGDMYFPFFTFLQFFFYMGWLKVAETLLNPFGEDDDDFDINGIIDRNLQVSYLIVDGMYEELPEMVKDQYWDNNEFHLPYTEASQPFHKEEHVGSASKIEVSEQKAQFLATVDEEVGSELATIRSQASDDDFGSRNLHIPGGKSRGASKYQKGSSQFSRSSNKSSSIFRQFSRRSSKTGAPDPEAPPVDDTGVQTDVPMKPINSKENNSNKQNFLVQDDLIFQMSDGEQSPSEDYPATARTVSETSPFLPRPTRLVKQDAVAAPTTTAYSEQPDGGEQITASTFVPVASVQPSVGSHVLEPVEETAEASDLTLSLLDQLRDLRTGSNKT